MKKQFVLMLILALVINTTFAASALPKLFLFLGGDEVASHQSKLKNACISGVQIIYSWKQLEPQKDVYDFSKIKSDLQLLSKMNKKLFIQIQDRSFEPTVYSVPDYLREDPLYHGGVAMQYDMPGEGKPISAGWVARVWDISVRYRFQLLLRKLADEFDGKVVGINLPETAVDFDEAKLPEGFSFASYYFAERDNISAARKAFHHSIVTQYVNFFPGEWNNDRQYMEQFFSYARSHHIGLGGPDGLPYHKSHMQNSYPFFHALKGKIFTTIAIQEPDYTYTNPDTKMPYQFLEFYHFVRDYLGANIIFWNIEEPFYSNQLVPNMNANYFQCTS